MDRRTFVTSTGGRWHWQGDDQETPDTQIATCKFADGKHKLVDGKPKLVDEKTQFVDRQPN